LKPLNEEESVPVPLNVLAVICNDYWMKLHLVPTLKATFKTVETFFYQGMARWYDPAWVADRPSEMRRLLTLVRSLKSAGKLDLIFMVVYDDFLFPETAAAIKKLGIRMINYHVDMPTQWYRCIRIAPYLDLIGVSHLDHFYDLTRYGARLLFNPMAANTEHFRPHDTEKQYDVLFLGSYTPPRADALAAAVDVTGSVYVAGRGWQENPPNPAAALPRRTSWKKYVHDSPYLIPRLRAEGLRMFATRDVGHRTYPKRGWAGGARYLGHPEDIVEAISKARIILGVNQRWGSIGSKDGCVNSRLRDFEAPACGSMYLAQRYPELSLYYKEDQQIAAWSTLDELRTKLEYYLRHAEERQAIAAAGRERVVRSHQWEHRYRALVSHLTKQSST